MSDRRRRVGGWGFEGERYPLPPDLLQWLQHRLGPCDGRVADTPPDVRLPGPRALPAFPLEIGREPHDRLAHARGQGLPDLLRFRTGTVTSAPDGVVRPTDDAQVEAILRACAAAGVRAIPFGGGTSVTGGVNSVAGDTPVVALDLERLDGLGDVDGESGLATFGAGIRGPALEAALARYGLTLGHFPQSWELSTLGGWIVTRSSGQESLGYGSIDALVAGLTLVAPAGRLELGARPASAAGPDLRHLVAGSEGRLGIVTRATVRVRRRPPVLVVTGTVLPSWRAGLSAARDVVQEGVPLTLLRLSDECETTVGMALGLARRGIVGTLVRRWLAARGAWEGGCLMLLGAAGDPSTVRRTLGDARAILRSHGGVGLGRTPGRRWLSDRFRHPYLRDALLDAGVATDTLETAAPWARLERVREAVGTALTSTLVHEDEQVVVLAHVSHPYRDGASLYFTLFFRCPPDPAQAIARWATLKRAATEAIVAAGATLSHHHGVGSWHAPWLEREIGPAGAALLGDAARRLDPTGILNPHVLLDPTDRLES
ncbi:MAG: FAD-binding oxidoreductase [Gemmatimonadota bacterium]|nr:FAD-binding oxidoreductase [Gemmatimonadota bacterium]